MANYTWNYQSSDGDTPEDGATRVSEALGIEETKGLFDFMQMLDFFTRFCVGFDCYFGPQDLDDVAMEIDSDAESEPSSRRIVGGYSFQHAFAEVLREYDSNMAQYSGASALIPNRDLKEFRYEPPKSRW